MTLEPTESESTPITPNGEQAGSTDLFSVGEIVENIGQAWCLCPYEWGIEDYITIQSSQGQLALCAVGKVLYGPNRGKLRYEPLAKSAVHDLSENEANPDTP